jgi:hypothetical protein
MTENEFGWLAIGSKLFPVFKRTPYAPQVFNARSFGADLSADVLSM